MSINTRTRDLYNKTKVFFVGTSEQIRESLSPRAINWASLAEIVIPTAATLGYTYFNQESPTYNLENLAAVLSAEGGLRLILPQLRPYFKRKLQKGIDAGKIFPIDQSILFEPTGLVGKARDAYDILHKIIAYPFSRTDGTNSVTPQS